jgi:tetratricopeptide (TPR) repeat protein
MANSILSTHNMQISGGHSHSNSHSSPNPSVHSNSRMSSRIISPRNNIGEEEVIQLIQPKPKKSLRKRFVKMLKKFPKSSSSSSLSSSSTRRTCAASSNNTSESRHKRDYDKSSLASLGTIDLSSYNSDFMMDDEDVDENHGLSSVGSALRLENFDEDEIDMDHCNGTVFGDGQTAPSPPRRRSLNEIDSSFVDVGRVDEFNSSLGRVEEHTCTYTHSHESSEEDRRIAQLFQAGKDAYATGAYENALQIQKQALKLVHEIAEQRTNSHNCGLMSPNTNTNNVLLSKREAAMIQYEITKIEFVIYKEKKYYSTRPNADAILSHLFNRMQNAKCIVSLQDLAYYRDQLSRMEEFFEATENHEQGCKAYTSQKIVILNALAKLCHKDLHQYENALQYYKQVLELECTMLSHFNIPDANGQNDHNDLLSSEEDEILQWKAKIRQTKLKIGAIHYLNGRVDKALLSSFSLY